MNKLETLANKYIRKINDKLFVLEAINSKDLESFNDEIILYKDYVVKNNISLSVNDLALVRTVNPSNFPIGLIEKTLQEQNTKNTFKSPFTDYLTSIKLSKNFYKDVDFGCKRDNMNIDDTYLSYPLYRDTKHFSLNGLVSNVHNEFGGVVSEFNNREIMFIEPFNEHLNDELVNLNPVDTFYNVKDKPFKIGDKAVFIIDYDTYKKLILNPKIKSDLDKVRVFLYTPKNIDLLRGRFNLQTCFTDIVLAYLGYIPTHSIGQIELFHDMYIDNDYWVTDDEYIKKFQDFIEELNQKLLDKSYYNIPSDIKENRYSELVNIPGLLHCETSYYDDEKRLNLESKIKTVKRYLNYLEERLGLDHLLSYKLYIGYIAILIEFNYSMAGRSFFPRGLEEDIIEFIKRVGYNELVKVTKEFNNIPVDIKDLLDEETKEDSILMMGAK